MKARARETAAEKAAKLEFDKHAQDYADQTAQGVIALMAYLCTLSGIAVLKRAVKESVI